MGQTISGFGRTKGSLHSVAVTDVLVLLFFRLVEQLLLFWLLVTAFILVVLTEQTLITFMRQACRDFLKSEIC